MDTFDVVEINPSDAEKIKQHLEKIRESQSTNSSTSAVVHEAVSQFNKFFLNYGNPYFTAHNFKNPDTPRSELYNENLQTLDSDLKRAYATLDTAAKSTLSSFNYATIITKEVANSATAAASKVLDLNILNGFTKGSVIVAGDDFINSSKIDGSVGTSASGAEILEGANAVALKRVDAVPVTGPLTKVTVTPVKPAGADGKVNTQPTPENLERFYEGRYYANLGQQNPEGGSLEIKQLVDPADIPASVTATEGDAVIEETIKAAEKSGFFVVVPVSEEAKQAQRIKMFDGNPDTFWECEFVYTTEPLLDPYESIDKADTTNATITIDLKAAEDLAKKYDFQGRDLQINIDLDFGSVTPVNFVLINPVIAGTSAFIKVVDVATAEAEQEFITVDGFADQAFDKVLTPEANKVLPGDIQAKSLAPNAFAYGGLGVFTFPVRFAQKMRLTLLIEDPVPAPYERLHLLMQEVITVTSKTKKSKKGL